MKTFFTGLICVFSTLLFAQETLVDVPTIIDSVTVYMNGAEIKRSGNVTVPAGRSELVVSGITHFMNNKSIQARLSGSAKILSIYTQQSTSVNKRVQIVGDSIALIDFEMSSVSGILEAYKEEKNLLIKNNARIGTDNGISVAELKTASDFYRSRIQEINKSVLEYTGKLKQASRRKDVLKAKKSQLSGTAQKPINEIVIQVKSLKSETMKVNVSYVVSQASWQPKYNIRSEGVEKPLSFEYLAKVYNRSEEDWSNVALTLSTGEPFKSIYKPTITPWTLSYRSDVNEGRLNKKKPAAQFWGDSKEMAEKVSLSVSYANVEVSELGVDFKVNEKYTILSGKKAQLVDVNEYELEASYKYFVVPKVDKDAFLLAQVVGWEKLNIIDGSANIYFNGTYVGASYLNTSSASDTLDVSLGRDRKIIVNRVKLEDFNSKKMIGLNRKETLSYEISLRNTYSKPIEIEVWDQIPISQESTIEVSDVKVSGAALDPVTGKLEWQTELVPGNSTRYKISFTVKYPRNKHVSLRKNRKVAQPRFW